MAPDAIITHLDPRCQSSLTGLSKLPDAQPLYVVYGSLHEVMPVKIHQLGDVETLVDLSIRQFDIPPGAVVRLYLP
jgi:hypothetical protein